MHFQPTATELTHLPSMSEIERIEYFLTRAIECEEVWSIADTDEWDLSGDGDKYILPVWPYQSMAQDYSEEKGIGFQSTSLEHFIDILGQSEESIDVEVLATPNSAGVLIDANELLGMFESLIDAGTYFLEG